MKTAVLASSLILGGLVGCATSTTSTGPRSASVARMPVTVTPALAATPNMPSSELSYLLALRAHGQGQLRLAAEHYARALAADKNHVGAHNGLGVIRAQEGRTEEALALFARSSELSPKSAHVHNNMGYTLLRADRLVEARLALKLAMELDPTSVQTLHNLQLLVDAERREQAAAAEALREQPVVNASGETAGALVVVAPQIYELRATTALSAVVPTVTVAVAPTISSARVLAVPAATLPPDLSLPTNTAMRNLRLEVTNGAGVERLARRTANQLAKRGVRVSRLTNQMPYRQVRTQIRYLAGQEAALQALVQHLPVAVERVAVSSLPAGMQLQLVLGRDFSGQAILARIDQQESEPATAQAQKTAPLS